jgi:hypothetical protein
MKSPQKNESTRDKALKALLADLAEKQDHSVALVTISGRALSRSANNIHVAVPSGIVAVPISNIQKVASVEGTQPGIVRLVVRDPHQIQSLLGVRPVNTGGRGQGGGGISSPDEAQEGDTVQGDLLVKGVWGVGVQTCNLYSSDTITGTDGNADACDDTETDDCAADDE